jgi:hypothetical protein
MLGDLSIGYCSSSPRVSENLVGRLGEQADFIEIPVHDDFLRRGVSAFAPDHFGGFLTLHGEGETDGHRRIRFSSPSRRDRIRYAKHSARMFNLAHDQIGPLRTRAVIVHPSTLSGRFTRFAQIEWFVESLCTLSDSCTVTEICVEPRGGNRQRKVVRSEIQDIVCLHQAAVKNGIRLGFCIDLAQTYCAYGTQGVANLIGECISHDIPIKEIHVSDVVETRRSKRLGMEIGTGRIDFLQALGHLRDSSVRLLIETIGGLPVFTRSLEHLKRLEGS